MMPLETALSQLLQITKLKALLHQINFVTAHQNKMAETNLFSQT
jgi:hypothetical protein